MDQFNEVSGRKVSDEKEKIRAKRPDDCIKLWSKHFQNLLG